MSPEQINTIGTIAGIIVAGLGAFLFAFWASMGIWAFNDIRSRSRDWLAIALACLLVLVFPIIGLILYMMIRPKETLADIYDRALEEETLLRELEGSSACHHCGSSIKEEWVYCATCHVQLQHSCHSCGNLVRAEWGICVHCGTAHQGLGPQNLGAQSAGAQGLGQSAQPHRPQAPFQPDEAQAMTSLDDLIDEDEQPEVAVVQRRGSRSNPFMRPARGE